MEHHTDHDTRDHAVPFSSCICAKNKIYIEKKKKEKRKAMQEENGTAVVGSGCADPSFEDSSAGWVR